MQQAKNGRTLCTPESTFSRNARQLEAWDATLTKRFVLYGGAAGGGKSFFLRWWCVFYLLQLFQAGISGAQVMLACEDYPSLLDRQISKIRYEFPRSLGELKESTTRDFVLNSTWGSGRILLRNLDDPAKYLSAEFAGIAVDELTRNDENVFNFLRSRLRWPGVYRPRFVGGTNPGGRGHKWVKDLWLEHEFPPELQSLQNEFAFIPAKASDNPYLSTQYYDDLKTLPPDMAKAYAEGSWEIFQGQFFDFLPAEWKGTPAAEIQLEPWWPRWIAIDWGFKHPAAAYWFARDRDRVITYREFHRSGTGERELGIEIASMSRGEKIQHVFLSPDAFAKRTSQNTIAEEIGDALYANGIPRPGPADDDRVGGARLCYQMLQTELVIISSSCRGLIKCLPTLIRDESNIEDVEKVDGDDPYDAWRYGLKTMLAPGHKPLDLRVSERITEMQAERVERMLPPQTDPTAIAMMSRAAYQKESERSKPLRVGGRFRRNRMHP